MKLLKLPSKMNLNMNKWFITGDTHGSFGRFYNLSLQEREDSEMKVIILGDAGWNFFLNKSDYNRKKEFHENCKFTVYCVRGNHEARPQSIPGMILEYDEEVQGEVYYEPSFPRIKYFKDFGAYKINGYDTLVLGGAYSVDKGYRLARAGYLTEEDNNPKRSGWWADEQLSAEEMAAAEEIASGKNWKFVLSHTCPYSWEPRDLFLAFIDQDAVDDIMERWMDKLRKIISWDIWLFGHFHQDRLVRPHVEMLSSDIESLTEIVARWDFYDTTNELDAWWYIKDPNFYLEDN